MTRNSDDSTSSSTDPTPSPASFVFAVLLSEGVLVLLALGLGAGTGTEWSPMMQGTTADVLVGVLGGLGLVTLHLILIVPGRERNPLYRTVYRPLHATLRPAVRDARLSDMVLVALASGVAEELLFRGWLQTEVGIVAASLLFGAAHVWERRALPYGLYAAGMGFVLGGLFAYMGQSLWAPILAHAVNNLIGLLALVYNWLPEPAS